MGRRKKDIRFDVHPPEPPEHMCEKEGCTNPGEFRAPKDRTLSEYRWFCLEHVKEYNSQWDYYAGMTPEEIETQLKNDVCWQRPTWKLGERNSQAFHYADPLGLMDDAFPEGEAPGAPASKVDPAVAAAAHILELTFPIEHKQLRTNYKRLAKSYHPDSNKGDKTAEEKFKDMQEAYRLIMSVLNKDAV